MKVFVLGLDSMPPAYFYDRAEELFPNMAPYILDAAKWKMRSCHPPITIPAWMVMFTGKTPGELGVYGFRHRKPGTFDYYIVNSKYFKAKTIWNVANERGLRVGLFGVPPTYPVKPLKGFMVSDFTTPSDAKKYTYPPWLREELEEKVGKPIFDISYRSDNKHKVKEDLLRMTENHMNILDYLSSKKKWDLFIHVEIAIDRAHHAFLRYFDKSHPKYEENEELNVIPHVYRKVDDWFGKAIKNQLKDSIIVFLSDHGIKPAHGSFVINQWLEERGFLKFKREPKEGEDLSEDLIDWNKTLAWGWGGYYSRIFINLKGREKYGIVEPKDYEHVITDLKKEILKLKGPEGESWKNLAYKPEELYPEVNGDAPDLMAYFDDLNWKAAGTVGWPTLYLPRNNRGVDDAVHDWYGILAIYDPGGKYTGSRGVIDAHEVFNILKELIESK